MNLLQNISGLKEIEEVLKKLPENMAKRATYGALRAGAAVIAKAARAKVKANPSIDSGLLEKNITSRARRRSKKGSAVVSVGIHRKAAQVVRKGRKKPVKVVPSRYAHLVEFGTEHSPAEPFMRPALDEQVGVAAEKVKEGLARAVEREARKLASGRRR